MAMEVNSSLYQSYATQNVSAAAKKKETDNQVKGAETKKAAGEVKQPKLSDAAQKLLEKLRKTYGDTDFMVADFESDEEARAALSRGNKAVSVLFSSEEIEKMAADPKCEQEYMDRIKSALRMSVEINRRYNSESADGKNGNGTQIKNIGVSFNADGTTTFFAELEKSSANQRERIEQTRENRRARRKEDAKRAEEEKQKERLGRTNDYDVKRTTVQANSAEELLRKIREVDWNTVFPERIPEAGARFDFSI